MRLAVIVAGVVYSCRKAWHDHACLVERTGATLIASLDDGPYVEAYKQVVRPSSTIVKTMRQMTGEIHAHIPWAYHVGGRLQFLVDEKCCHTPYLLHRRFVAMKTLDNLTRDFDHILVIRPDTTFNCETVSTHMTRWSNAIGMTVQTGFTAEYSPPHCPRSMNDQWFFGDTNSVRTLLLAYPRLSTWHHEWRADHRFDKWWLVDNKMRPGRFFLNAEGIYGKTVQKLGLNCTVVSSPFTVSKNGDVQGGGGLRQWVHDVLYAAVG